MHAVELIVDLSNIDAIPPTCMLHTTIRYVDDIYMPLNCRSYRAFTQRSESLNDPIGYTKSFLNSQE